MSDPSGTSSDVIAVPTGGGAVRGIGETFSPDLHTGTGNFSVPLAVPPGRGGFQPELSLAYSTGNGNGAFGLGWSLSIPGISRRTSRGVPRYDDDVDVFTLSQAEELVPTATLPSATRYQPRTEGQFARILHHRDNDDDYWEVRTRDGLRSVYGTPDAAGDDPAAVADPDDRSRVFAWQLTRTLDPYGNRIEYAYLRDSGEDGLRRWDQLYLTEIRYGDYLDANGDVRFLASVTFDYGTEDVERPDPFSSHRPGFEVRTRRRCERITVRTHAEETRRVRSYELVYLDQRVARGELPGEALPPNGVSLLSQILVIGHDGEHTQALPPLELGYTRFDPEGRDLVPIEGADLPARSLAAADLELADLSGNGLPDVLQMNGVARYWRNLGDGRFDRPRPMRDAPAGLGLADPGVQLLDADGDARIDLMVTSAGLSGYFPLSFDGSWERRSFQRHDLAPSFDPEDPRVRLVDLDGDGVTDAVRSGGRLECYFNDPREGWHRTRHVERRPLAEFPDVDFADPRVRFADLTGDGLQDVVLLYDANVEYWPNQGHGDFGPRVHMRDSPRFPYGYDPRRVLIGDVDGDGLADLVYVDHRKVVLWINRGGNGWSEPIEIDGTPPVTDMDAVRLADVLGTGVGGVLWSADARVPGRPHHFFLDFTGGVKPYLLHEKDNHMGAVTRVAYQPSTRFYLADQQRRETRWQTPLPFPVQVVTRVEVVDQLSGGKLTTCFTYRDGYWDGADREFRGFGRVDQLDTETFEQYHAPGPHADAADFEDVEPVHFSPPTLTRTWFHQGPIGPEHGEWHEGDVGAQIWQGDPPQLTERPGLTAILEDAGIPRRGKRDALRTLRGSVLRTELYALDGSELADRPYVVTESLYDVREESPPAEGNADRQRIFFPHRIATRTTRWERGEDPMTRFSFTGDYDAYGQPRAQTDVAVPRGRDFNAAAAPGEPYLGTHSVTRYAYRDDDALHLTDRACRVTTREIDNDGSPQLSGLLAAVLDGSASLPLLGQTLTYYDGEAFTGLPLGQLGDFGAPARIERLVLTEDVVHRAYRGGEPLDLSGMPPYLDPEGLDWTDDYPEAFRDSLPALAGYVFHPGDADRERGYFVRSDRRRYDFHDDPATARGLPRVMRDPLDNDTRIAYDAFGLLPVAVTGPTGLATEARYDYRVMQPRRVTGPNGNRTAFSFTPLGLLASTAVMGREGEAEGDTPEVPGTRQEYDLLAFHQRGQPVSVRTVGREHHVHDTGVPQPERDATIETVEHSDGFGRLLQTRTQAEDAFFGDGVFAANAGLPIDGSEPGAAAAGRRIDPGEAPRVVVSGWQVYDNKGRVVVKYQPFFSAGYDFMPPREAEFGQRVTTFRDPLGRAVRVLSPDGSEQRMVHGVPAQLSDPETFAPTPWEVYTYDANDNAGRTHPEEAGGYPGHWDTPASAVVDALDRTVETVQRNRAPASDSGDPTPPIEEIRTRTVYDLRGNPLEVIDALDRPAFRTVYDLAGNSLRVETIDAGLTRTTVDAAGRPIEQRDGKGALALSASDALGRPIRVWARDDASQAVTLRQTLIYGDSEGSGLDHAAAAQRNLLGRLSQHYDEAGRVQVTAYDFKGNLLEKTRRVIRDAELLSVFDGAEAAGWRVSAYQVDWQPGDVALEQRAAVLLDPTPYVTTTVYDALNRARSVTYPRDVEGRRRVLTPSYNRAGALERVALASDANAEPVTYVEHVAYDAGGRRTLIAYGNGVMTRYAYDPRTFRLRRLRSERFLRSAELHFQPVGAPLQDFAYAYDLSGNITAIHDRTPESGIANTLAGLDALDRVFAYDAVYRLVSATGREHASPPPAAPWDDRPRTQDATLTRAYTERYRYDVMGNLEQIRHLAGGGGSTRDFAFEESNNRLVNMTIGQAAYVYAYDASGNMIRETSSRFFEWNYKNRLTVFRTQTTGAEPSIHACYLYDATGERVKKLVRRQGGVISTTVTIDGLFEHHLEAGLENQTLQVADERLPIARVRIGPPSPGDASPSTIFQLSDHQDSSNLVLDNDGALVNREEYTPHGETSFGSFSRRRYRYTGKQRDEESGLYYHGARYYAPWLTRWASPDPGGLIDGVNLYRFVRNNPIKYNDPDGTNSKKAENLAKAIDAGRRHEAFIEGALKDAGATYVKQTKVHSVGGKKASFADFIVKVGDNEFVVIEAKSSVYTAEKKLVELGAHGNKMSDGQLELRDAIQRGEPIEIVNSEKAKALGYDPETSKVRHLLITSDDADLIGEVTEDVREFNARRSRSQKKRQHEAKAEAKFRQKKNASSIKRRGGSKKKLKSRGGGKGNLLISAGFALFMGGATLLATGDAKAAGKVTVDGINPLANTTDEIYDNGFEAGGLEAALKQDAADFVAGVLMIPSPEFIELSREVQQIDPHSRGLILDPGTPKW